MSSLPPEYSYLPGPGPMPRSNMPPAGVLVAFISPELNTALDPFPVLRDAGLGMAKMVIDVPSRRLLFEIRGTDNSILSFGLGRDTVYVIAIGKKYHDIAIAPAFSVAPGVVLSTWLTTFSLYVSAAADKIAKAWVYLPAPLPILIDAFAGGGYAKQQLAQLLASKPVTPPSRVP